MRAIIIKGALIKSTRCKNTDFLKRKENSKQVSWLEFVMCMTS